MDLPARPAQQAGEIVQALHVPELKAWMQAKDRPDTPTTPPTQVPAAPVQPTEPNGQPTWLVVSLGGLAAALALVAGLALLAARRANRRARSGTRPIDRHGHAA
jgi:hypothetical protein